ncbi:hypothetical protein [Streptomyces ficellus]|uniref:Protein kinase domain-containing protein n=1 Tax=Streptomyces ficellus TaxID=1977088 RepID=A0A6I6FT95_9ACTN|nr:hypothetical protein [Streptomyces ficellus]QGV80286.1 hypothetical protein EIZ62_20145 [Streptomyces ficellus]
MTAEDGEDVPLSGLRLLDRIGDGGQGEVHAVAGPPGILYKAYRPALRPDGGALAALVRVRRDLVPDERDWWDERTAWPLCRVTDGGRVTGFLMRRAPDSMTWRPPGGGGTKLTELAYLLRPAKAAWRAVVQPTPEERYALAVAVVDLVDRLHAMGLVLGDLSQANVLWTVRPAPAVHLLDCDGIRQAGRGPVLAQADTIDWNDPLAPPGAVTVDSDRYKAALALGRILAQDPYTAPGTVFAPVPGVLDERREAAVRRLYVQAAGPFGSRPSLGEWRTALSGRGVIKLLAARPAPRPAVDPSKFDGARRRGTISLRE